MNYTCMVCEHLFESDKEIGKIEEEWSNPALCPICNSDEIRESSSKEGDVSYKIEASLEKVESLMENEEESKVITFINESRIEIPKIVDTTVIRGGRGCVCKDFNYLLYLLEKAKEELQ